MRQLVLRLEEIKFNHDASSASVDAFNIRKNEKEFVQPPEWRRDVSINPEDSLAAYGICDTCGNTLTIEANFSCDEHNEGVSIRALDPHTYRDPVNGNLSTLELELLESVVPGTTGNVLGEVKSKTVTCSNGQTGYQPFDLDKVRIWDTGVGVENIVWRWQYCLRGTDSWIDFAVTTHRIYTALQVPTGPWMQKPHEPSQTQLPWSEVLEHACKWAAGAQNTDDAAHRITHSVNECGPKLIEFDIVNHASSHYSNRDKFDCTAFLSRLRGEPSLGPRVNCSDCAAVVSTFANSIGCELEQSRMKPVFGLPAFPLEEHLRIGLPGRMKGAFLYHEVAWEGECQEDDEVFDASLRVDGDDNPSTFTALLPTNLEFGVIGQRGYRSRLVPTGREPTCLPNPSLKTRRKLGPVSSPKTVPDMIAPLKDIFIYDSWSESEPPGTKHFLLDYSLGDFLPGWRILSQQESGVRGRRPFIQSFWEREPGAVDGITLRIDVCEGSLWTDAREILLTFLTEFQLPDIRLQEQSELGDVAFAGPEGFAILFATANLAFLVRNVGTNVIPVMDVAAAITKRLLSPPLIVSGLDGSFKPARQFRFETNEIVMGNRVHIHEEPAPPSAPRKFYRFFSNTGEVSVVGEHLFYRPLKVGFHMLEIFAVDARGAIPTQRLPLQVRNS